MHAIRKVNWTVVSLPVKRRIVSRVRDTGEVINILVEVVTEEGASGNSYIAAFTRHKARATCAIIDELGEVIHGQDATAIGMLWEKMWHACTLIGHSGIAAFAISAIDMALWDLQGKLLNTPLHRLLGTRHTRLQTYASDGCWLYEDPAHIAQEADEFAAAGFQAIKIRFGRADTRKDFAVLAAARNVVPDMLHLMVDVNQGWSRAETLKYAPQFAEYGVEWLEEPLPAEDVAGLAQIRQRVSIPIVAGENSYMPSGARALLDAHAVAMLMPDMQRVGGITGWQRAAALAESMCVPITSHLFPEISVHLLASAAQVGPMEWVTWLHPVLAEPLLVKDGYVEVPQQPGTGIAFDPEAVRRYRLEL